MTIPIDKLFCVKVDEAKASYENKMQTHVEKIIKNLKCYQCSDIPGPNQEKRYSCHYHSHQLCAKCKDLGSKCESPVMDVPNSVVENLLKDLPFFCGNYKRKCRQIFSEIKTWEDHMKICEFRLMSCPSRNCLENVTEILECYKCENRNPCNSDILLAESVCHKHSQHPLINLCLCKVNSGATYLTIPYKSWDEHSKQKHDKQNNAYILPRTHKNLKIWKGSIPVRLPGSAQYCEVLKKKIWNHETSLHFIRIDNGDKFVLIGEVKDDSVYFWLCICGCESREYMYTLCYDDYQNIKKGTTFHRFQKSQSESVRLLDECPHKISRHDFSINLDIAKKMEKEGSDGFELEIYSKFDRVEKKKKSFATRLAALAPK